MRPSSNRLSVGQDPIGENGLRASDAERDEAIGELRSRFAEGRLSQDTFLYRMDAALQAKERSELSELFTDLPAESRPGGSGHWLRDRLARFRQAAGGAGAQFRVRAGQRPASAGPAPFAAQPEYRAAAGYPAEAGYPAAAGYPVPAGQFVAAGHQVPAPPPQSMFLPRQQDRRFSIGRAPTCDFTVSDISVSRWHARLHKEDATWLLQDLGSTNGTRVNGWRVTAAVPVRPGDQLAFGNAVFVLLDNSAEQDQSVAADNRRPGAD
jgi:Domain of unknown function (DUF1707)/Inner membrane component of T3SS, cytoplasmic domain